MTGSDAQALRQRLRWVRRRKGRTHRGATSGPVRKTDPPPGQVLPTPYGVAFRIQKAYPLEYIHGLNRLDEMAEIEPNLLVEVLHRAGAKAVGPESLVFMDTETTGLAGGAGTLIFLVGVGAFAAGVFRLRQYFLRVPSEENAMLFALQDEFQAAEGIVSFNGRAFDLPLLEMRYVMGLGKRWLLTQRPQLDLLPLSRRLWRRELPDCTLSTLERRILKVVRSGEDVPGTDIPGLYRDYLRTGDWTQMERVIYHNAVDVLSLVVLATQILQRHHQDRLGDLSASEALAIARWHQNSGRSSQADLAYEVAAGRGEGEIQLNALKGWTLHLRRQKRYAEAMEGWQVWHQIAPEDPIPCIEMAKAFEWRIGDLLQARDWAQEALQCLGSWPEDWRRAEMQRQIQHRQARLAKKIAAGGGD